MCVFGVEPATSSMVPLRDVTTKVPALCACCGLVGLQDTWRDVPYDWASLLENVLDASHVPFTHHK